MNLTLTLNTYLRLHLIELKYNIFFFLISFLYLLFICSYFSDQLIYLFTKPLLQLKILKYFIYTDITEIFFLNFYLSILISILIFFPFFILQLWFFFSKGLTKNENIKILKCFLFFCIFNFNIIFLICIKIIPNLWIYFYNINSLNNYLLNIYFEPKINNYFLFFFTFYIYIYLFFLYPFILYFLILFNIFKIKTFIYLRKFFYLKFIIIAAIVSPPDIISQVFIVIPLIIFFEIYIYLYILYKKYN
jgi:sec-independent protein translocase protein TatC